MKIIKALAIGLSIFYCSAAFAQSRYVSVKLRLERVCPGHVNGSSCAE